MISLFCMFFFYIFIVYFNLPSSFNTILMSPYSLLHNSNNEFKYGLLSNTYFFYKGRRKKKLSDGGGDGRPTS